MNIISRFDASLGQRNPNARLSRRDVFTRIRSNPSDWEKIEQIAAADRLTPTEVLQSISPYGDGGSENAGLDFLHSEGVYVKSAPELGIVPIQVMDVANMSKPTQRIFHSYMIDQQKVGIHAYADKQRELKKYADAMHRLKVDDSLDEIEKGSILRQWVDFINLEMYMVVPAFESVYGRVLDSMGDSPRVTESRKYTGTELLQNRPEGTIPHLVELQFIPNSVNLLPQVIGVTYSRSQSISSGFNAELLAGFQTQAGQEAMTDQVTRGLKLMYSKGKQATVPTFDADSDGLIDLVMSAPRDYIWTSVFGNKAAIAKYLGIDRSKFFGNSRELAGASAVGSDFYARAPLPRYVSELHDGQDTVVGLGTDELLLVDARFAVDLYNWFAFEMEVSEFNAIGDRFWQLRNIQTGPGERFPSKPTAAKPFQVVKLVDA